jgi:Tol biopolymer transport system component
MSPEQVQGLDVDHRTDIFSLGVVLYEMLAGEPPFKGIHETAVMYEIVNVDAPPLSTIKEGIAPEIDEIVLECLEKDKDERCQSAKELAKDLRKIKKSTGSRKSKIYNVNTTAFKTQTQQLQNSNPTGSINIKGITGRFKLNTLILAASFLIVIILAVLAAWNLHPEPVKEVRKFQWTNYDYDWCVLSPDGKKIAYSKGEKLWIRSLDKIEPIEIKNEEPISNVIWSPKSDYIAYFTGLQTDNHQLRKVAINGMENTLIVKTEGNYYPRFWGSDDSILVTSWDLKASNILLKVPSSGGELKPICGGDPVLSTISGELTHVLELPDGKSIIICNNLASGRGEILIQTDNKRKVIYSNPQSYIGRPVYSNSGEILFPLTTRTNSVPDIWAIPFDPGSLKITGNPYLVARNADQISVSSNGMLFYIEQSNYSRGVQLVEMSRSGTLLKIISQPQLEILSPSVSPDGKFIATSSLKEGEKYDIWVHDLTKGTKSQLSFDVPQTWRPNWSPDGKQIVFQSGFFDTTSIYVQATNGLTSAKLLLRSNEFASGPIWSPDGRFIFYTKSDKKLPRQDDIWYYEINNGGSPKPLFESRFNEALPYPSPDGRFVAYESDKSGQWEIYVTNFPNADKQWMISSNGGANPQWIGNEIFYTSQKGNNLMSVKVKTTPDFQSGIPEKLFSADSAGVQLQTTYSFFYTVTRDGKNIIAVKNITSATLPKMVLVENWIEELKEKR